MPRRKDEAVAEQAEGTPRRRGRKAAEAEAPEQPKQPKPEKPRAERKPRVHQDLLTVAFRGPLAIKFRELAERHQLSLARLLQDALLAYEGHVSSGYEPGSALAEWKAQQPAESAGT